MTTSSSFPTPTASPSATPITLAAKTALSLTETNRAQARKDMRGAVARLGEECYRLLAYLDDGDKDDLAADLAQALDGRTREAERAALTFQAMTYQAAALRLALQLND